MKYSMLHGVLAGVLAGCMGLAVAQEGLRPEVGKPLQAAQELVKAGRYKEALAKVRDAEAVGGKSANESFMIERMRMAAASGAGDADTAARSYDAIAGSPKVSAADKLKMVESIAGSYYRSREYAKSMQWAQRYFRDGGGSPAIRTMLIQSQYLAGDFAGAAKELNAEVAATEKAGGTPGEDRLKLLLNAALKLNDTNGYVHAVEKLVTYYPKKEYWVDLLTRMQRKSNFSDRFALDAFRLSLATGSMSAPGNSWRWRSSLCRPVSPPRRARPSTRATPQRSSASVPKRRATSACATWCRRHSTTTRRRSWPTRRRRAPPRTARRSSTSE